jgi:hypothetical protein
LLKKLATLLDLERDIDARIAFGLDVTAKGGVFVRPRLNPEEVTADTARHNRSSPTIVSERSHARALPGLLVERFGKELDCKPAVAVHEHIGFDRDRLADDTLGCKSAGINRRRDVLDDEAQPRARKLRDIFLGRVLRDLSMALDHHQAHFPGRKRGCRVAVTPLACGHSQRGACGRRQRIKHER